MEGTPILWYSSAHLYLCSSSSYTKITMNVVEKRIQRRQLKNPLQLYCCNVAYWWHNLLQPCMEINDQSTAPPLPRPNQAHTLTFWGEIAEQWNGTSHIQKRIVENIPHFQCAINFGYANIRNGKTPFPAVYVGGATFSCANENGGEQVQTA